MPKNIAQLLYVVRILLEYGRHLAATIERRAAAPGFGLFAALFGTAKLPVILAYLHRGILRATALESLLLKRAATGRDVAVAPIRPRSAPGARAKADPVEEPIVPQIERLAAERAKYDAPADPDHLPTLEEIEAQVRNRPIGRTIADICRDLGIVPGLCTRAFWDAAIEAIVCYEGSAVKCWQDMNRKSEQFQREQEQDPAEQQMQRQATSEDRPETKQMDRGGPLYVHQPLGFKLGEPLVDPFSDVQALAQLCQNLSGQGASRPPVDATGPPSPAGMRLAA